MGFTVEDNGVGFTPENTTSFETLDSDHKADMGCRGVGRLLWLKAFDRVTIRSAYEDEAGRLDGRQFHFSVQGEVELDPEAELPTEVGAAVSLDGFKKPYQQSALKSVEAIAREVFEHCIWYFLRPGGAPHIMVADDDGAVSLNSLLHDFVYSDLQKTSIDVKGERFDMVSLRLKSSPRNHAPRLYWCAANRVVLEENLTSKVPGLYGRLKDSESSPFTYVCYLSSDFLDSHVRADRTAFDISEQAPGTPLSNHAPRYRPVLSRLEPLGVTVDPSIKDQELELLLHSNLQKLEASALAEGHAVLGQANSAPPEGYDDRLARYLHTVTDINQSDLAAYVSRRRAILDVLQRLVEVDDQGRYSREDAIHSLLMPMRTDFNEVGTDASNLWIIDEQLAFHDYLASDKTLKSMPITGSDSTREPDLLATRLVGSPVLAAEGGSLPLPSIVVVEVKRPMRNDASEDKDPIQQCLNYVKRVRAGGVKTALGRPIPPTREAPAFCYASTAAGSRTGGRGSWWPVSGA